MVPVKPPAGTTIQYVIEPMLHYRLKRVTSNEEARIEEDILRATDLVEVRLTARALTEYERAHPEEADARVINFGDVEIH